MDTITNSKSVENRSAFENFVNWMEKSINPDIDPTEDFLEYACGSFNEENYNPTQGEHPPNCRAEVLERIIQDERIDCPLMRKVRDFYNSLPTDLPSLLQNQSLIDYCGGFPAFNENWTSENFDWVKAAAILSALGVNTILNTNVSYSSNKKVIFIRNNKLSDCNLKNVKKKLKSLNLNDEKISEIINDTYEIKEHLRRITTNEYLNEFKEILFGDLEENLFDFQKYFQSYFGHSLVKDDKLQIHNYEPEYVIRYLNMFMEIPPRTIANYITFKAANTDLGDNWRLQLVTKYFAPVLFSVGINWYCNDFEIEKRNVVLRILRNSVNIFNKDIELDPNDINRLVFFPLNEKFIQANFQYNRMTEEYGNLEIGRNNFFQNFIIIQNLGHTNAFKICHSQPFENDDMYNWRKFLEFLTSHDEKPLLHYFSKWNANNWYTLLGLVYCQDDDLKVTLKQQLEIFDGEINLRHFIFYTIPYYLYEIEKLRRAYEDYDVWLAENEDEEKMQDEILKRLNLNSRKAFFVNYVQQYCSEKNERRNCIILALLNCEQFANVFECRTNSRMNPNNKLKIIWSKG